MSEAVSGSVGPSIPEHELWTEVVKEGAYFVWHIEHCKCGWVSDPKLSEFKAMDEGAKHVEVQCGEDWEFSPDGPWRRQ